MLIVAGRIYVNPNRRETFLESSMTAIVTARGTPGCRDFVVAADPIERDRVNVYEAWDSADALLAFREDGPSADLSSLIVRADVAQFTVDT